jgi:hypothetical protein
MSTFYLMNTTYLGTAKYLAGRKIDDSMDPASAIRAAGGVLWPSADTSVAAAALVAQKAHAQGADENILNGIMITSLAQSTLDGQAATQMKILDSGSFFGTDNVEAALQALGGGSAGSAAGVVAASKLIGFADVAALGASMTGHIDFAAALPANSRFLGATVKVATLFQNAGDTATIDTDLGDGTTADLYIGDANLHTTGEKFKGDASANQFQEAGAVTPRITFTSSVNLSTITAGSATYKLFYIVLA